MRIFLASPKDVVLYRGAAQRLAERLNEEHGAKLGSEYFLEVVDWNTHVADLQSLPEKAILEEITVGEHDVFLGIAWLGFDQQAADGDGSALSTERNFELAFKFWQRDRADQCFLCRCMRLPEKLTDINGKAFHRISEFFSRFSLDGENPIRYYEFDSATDLEEHLANQLAKLIEEWNGGALVAPSEAAPAERATAPAAVAAPAAPAAAAAAPAAPVAEAAPATAETTPGTEFERRMEVGSAYEVSFLSIEIVETDQIAEARKTRAEGVATLLDSFRRLVQTTAAAYGGELFSWNERGGLVLFWRNRSYDHAIMTGLKVLHNLPVFNLDPAQNPVAVSVKTRAAAHDAVILFQLPIENIHSEDIDYVIELQHENTDAAEIAITRRLLERIDNRLKPHFQYKGRFENEPVYICRLPSADNVPSKSSLVDFRRRLKQQTSQVREVLALPSSELDITSLESMSTAVDETYSVLNKFCTAFSSVDRDWPRDFFTELATATADLRREEEEIWRTLRKSYISGSFSAGKARRLEAIVRSASRRRSRPVVILEKLEERCRHLVGDGPAEEPAAAAEVADELLKKLDAFNRADALDSETILTDLLLNRKHGLLEYLGAGDSDDGRRQQLLDKLWQTVDLVLLDDLYSIRGHQRANEEKVFDVLVAERVADGRFGVVRRHLESEEEPTDERMTAEFAEIGRELGEEDSQRVWRCVVLGHPMSDLRNFAAFKLTAESMWQAISHPSIPIPAIYAIGERINKVENEDAKKIFFDCVRERLEGAVESFRTRDELSILTKVVLLLLDFPFLVETGYFERFDDILGKFLERANKAGLKVEYFESLRKTLEAARKKSGDKPSKPPAGLNKLPLTLQRRLAGESRYVYWFVSHPDPRIAGETLRHVGLMNVERVLRLREVNKSVLTALLRKPELFTRSQTIVTALNHPKCDHQFSGRHIPALARSRSGLQELQKIANNPSANPIVRSAAKRAAAQSRRGR